MGGDDFMRKILIIVLLIIGIVVLTEPEKKECEEIRVRILANSNQLSDQIDKIEVKEEVIKILQTFNQADLILMLKSNLSSLEDKIKANLPNALAQKIQVEYKKVNFPAKSVDGKMIKAGQYQTLLITIDEGKGKNWWSVLYPAFFNVEYDDNNEIEYRLYLKEWFGRDN